MKKYFVILILQFVSLLGICQNLEKFVDDERKFGYRDKSTKQVIINPSFGIASNFLDGLAIVSENLVAPNEKSKVKIINSKGEFISHDEFDDAENLGKGFIRVQNNDRNGSQGQINLTGGLFGIIDSKGNLILPIEYMEISNIDHDMLIVRNSSGSGVIDLNGKFLLPVQSNYAISEYLGCNLFAYNVIATPTKRQSLNRNGLIDINGTIILNVDSSEFFVKKFDEKFKVAPIQYLNNYYGVINNLGKIIIPKQDEFISVIPKFENNLIIFKSPLKRIENQYDLSGKLVKTINSQNNDKINKLKGK